MLVQALNNVSFGRIKTTKNGNQYQKAHTATIAGALGGLGYSGYTLYKINKGLKNPAIRTHLLRRLVPSRAQLIEAGMEKSIATNTIKKVFKTSLISTAAILSLLGLGIGAGINKIVNHYRAKRADKLAAQTVEKK